MYRNVSFIKIAKIRCLLIAGYLLHKRLRTRFLLTLMMLLLVIYFLLKKKPGEEVSFIHPFSASGEFFVQHKSMLDINPDVENKIDWHDREMIEKERLRTGLGEKGEPVIITDIEKKACAKLTSLSGYNACAGDKISLTRSLPDIRHKDCDGKKYLKKLPKVSIVIPFWEEHFSSLIRTVISSLNRAPPELIKEVILVDDGSTHKEFLQKPLENYIAKTFPTGVVRLIRAKKREGLIRARIMGANNATGEVILFLDCHCEPNVNYLPPLLEPIAENYKTVTCPFIDVISMDDFAYRSQDEGMRGVFAWDFHYKRLNRFEEDKKHPVDPFESPVMAGGLFAISKRWFDELGQYDPGLFIWGGEQYELSFKLWMCGGKMLDIPCSRIGHIYRHSMPFKSDFPNSYAINHKRVAEVWMDDYKHFIYKRHSQIASADPGDISNQLELRNKLKCKDFNWFLNRVAPDLIKFFPVEDPEPRLSGTLSMKISNKNYCLESSLTLGLCTEDSAFWEYTYDESILNRKETSGTVCLDSGKERDKMIKVLCHGLKWHQQFEIKFVNSIDENPTIIMSKNKNLCLTLTDAFDAKSQKLSFEECGKTNQHWNWQNVTFYSKVLERYQKYFHLEGFY